MPNHDPIASLAPAAIIVTLDSQDFTIPASPALAWLQVLLQKTPSLLDIVPGMLDVEERVQVEELIATDVVSWQDIHDTACEAIAAVTGRDWWFVLKLIATARNSWDAIGGMLAREQIDAAQISLGAWVDAVYLICCEQLSQGKEGRQNVTRFVSELEAPPPGVEINLDEEAEAAAFERAVRGSQL